MTTKKTDGGWTCFPTCTEAYLPVLPVPKPRYTTSFAIIGLLIRQTWSQLHTHTSSYRGVVPPALCEVNTQFLGVSDIPQTLYFASWFILVLTLTLFTDYVFCLFLISCLWIVWLVSVSSFLPLPQVFGFVAQTFIKVALPAFAGHSCVSPLAAREYLRVCTQVHIIPLSLSMAVLADAAVCSGQQSSRSLLMESFKHHRAVSYTRVASINVLLRKSS